MPIEEELFIHDVSVLIDAATLLVDGCDFLDTTHTNRNPMYWVDA